MKLLAGLVVAGLLFTGCDRSQSGQEMITMIRCQEVSLEDSETETYASIGRWQSGEFRYCRSLKLPEYEHEPQLKCDPALALLPEGAAYDHGKILTVRFVGGLPYDLEQKAKAENEWRCQRMNDAKVPFVCTAISPQH